MAESSWLLGLAGSASDRVRTRRLARANAKPRTARRVERLLPLGLLSGLVLLAATAAFGQEPRSGETETLREARNAALEAERAAAEARAFADLLAAQAGADDRAERPALAEDVGESSSGSQADPSSSTVAVEAAVARAEAAAERAVAAARAVAEVQRAERRAPRRAGPYLGAAFLYAAENFDDRIIVKSSTGGAGFLGYRFGSAFAAEVRYEGFEGFDLRGSTGRGEIDGFVATLSLKVYPFPGRLQPFAGVGAGVVRFEQRNVFGDGSRSRYDEIDGAFRFAGGIDAWLTDSIVLNAEVAYLGPVDDLSNLDLTILSTGLTYRF